MADHRCEIRKEGMYPVFSKREKGEKSGENHRGKKTTTANILVTKRSQRKARTWKGGGFVASHCDLKEKTRRVKGTMLRRIFRRWDE